MYFIWCKNRLDVGLFTIGMHMHKGDKRGEGYIFVIKADLTYSTVH